MNKISKWLNASEKITPEWILSLNIPKRKPQDVNKVEHQVVLELVDFNKKLQKIISLHSDFIAKINLCKQILEKHLNTNYVYLHEVKIRRLIWKKQLNF